MDQHKPLYEVEFDKYFKTDSWEEANKAFFNQLAPKYDRLNKVISLGQQESYKFDTLKALELRPGMRVLDVCTGSGDMAIKIAQHYQGITIDAIDVAQEMLAIAQAKVNQLGLTNIQFHQASALQLPFDDNHFDGIVMGFGLRNLKNMKQGLAEMHRVLKPGGNFTSLDLNKPSQGWQKALYHCYFERLMPWLGKTVFHRREYNSFAYLSVSNKFFPSSYEIMRVMNEVNFIDVHDKKYMFEGIAQQVGTKP